MTDLRIRDRVFGPTDLVVMAILNRTRDSFLDGGRHFEDAAAFARVDEVVEQGADLLDVGGVRAGHGEDVSVAEELRRVLPVIEYARSTHPGLLLSVDTWRAEVAQEAGADVVNDTWSAHDPRVIEVAAATGATYVCSHTPGLAPRTDPFRVEYDDVVADVVARLRDLAAHAVAAGLPPERVIVDPTHDFGKNTYHSLEVTRRLAEVVAIGHPVLVATSRKDFIGEALDLPKEQRLEATLAVNVVCALAGARVFRVHDVAEHRRALDMVRAVRGDVPPVLARRGLV